MIYSYRYFSYSIVFAIAVACGAGDFSSSSRGGPIQQPNTSDVKVDPSDSLPPVINPVPDDITSNQLPYVEPPATTSYAQDIQAGTFLNAKAFYSVLDTIKDSSCEREITEQIHSIFKQGGSLGTSFDTIVASGPNALVLHYSSQQRCLKQQELVKIDIGSKMNGYASDNTRTFPASGKFTPRQREVYELVLATQKAVIDYIVPGKHSLAQAHAFAVDYLSRSPLRAEDKNGNLQKMNYFFTHSLGHYIGRNVHGKDLSYSQFEPLQPGQVVAIEPGIYLPKEEFGIRIEDDFIVGDRKLANLNPNLIVEADHIEAYMSGDLIVDERINSN